MPDEPSLIVSPSAAALIHSLRGFGYSPETAVADLIDNSISAQAHRIDLTCDWLADGPEISLADDGDGMSLVALLEALRFGTLGPQAERSPSDLGRFGLGLKTASLSQCRCLTVVSRTSAGEVTGLRWDLDHVERESAWALLRVPEAELGHLLARLPTSGSGTLVVWQKVDFGRRTERPSVVGLRADAERIERHLCMTFHRFLTASGTRRLHLRLNGRELKAWDPMQEHLEETRPRPEQRIASPGGVVTVRGFVLPHRDRFPNEQAWEKAGGPAGWTAQQGFYIYRCGRLISAGGWLGLGGARAWTREESSRLARIRVDVPNSADADWCIDVRKSIARPPRSLADRLTGIATDVRKIARDVYVHRGAYGARPAKREVSRIWEARGPDQVPRYRLRRDHPALQPLVEHPEIGGSLEAALVLIERTVPVERIWLDAAEQAPAPVVGAVDDELLRNGVVLVRQLIAAGLSASDAARKVAMLDPFDTAPDIESQFLTVVHGRPS